MKTLKENIHSRKWNNKDLAVAIIKIEEDIKEAVLEFKKYLNGDTRNIQEDSLNKKYNEIFGDWEK